MTALGGHREGGHSHGMPGTEQPTRSLATSPGARSPRAWVWGRAVPLHSCVIFDKLLALSVPRCLHR